MQESQQPHIAFSLAIPNSNIRLVWLEIDYGNDSTNVPERENHDPAVFEISILKKQHAEKETGQKQQIMQKVFHTATALILLKTM